MKVYTKTGDKGTTSLFGGTKVSKNNIRLEAYGTVDELNSVIGMLRSLPEITSSINNQLLIIQKRLFTLGAELATPNDKLYLANGRARLPKTIEAIDIDNLEHWIDEMDKNLPPMTHFIIPGGQITVAQCHITRTVCRRAERITVALSEIEPIANNLIIYLNRLSDYLFVLGRYIAHSISFEEIKWLSDE